MRILLALFVLLLPALGQAKPPRHLHKKPKVTVVDPWVLKQPGESTYVVKKGDTLKSISAKHEVYGDGMLWFSLLEQNRDVVSHPAELKVGTVLHYKAKRMGLMPDQKDNKRLREKAGSWDAPKPKKLHRSRRHK